ncbi:efflux RND transporter periplasmic adaptor subunit [Sandaracinobacteroides saxicola]|nr:efflux RND transporter periplasmic adaptor subunit [Sandaracinobacteroides saxicola]
MADQLRSPDDSDAARRSRRRRILLYAAAALVVAAIIAFYALRGGKPEPAPAPTRAKVTVMVPGMTAVRDQVTASGSIAARRDMPVGVAGEGGQIVAIRAEAGSRVAKGQVLAEIDARVLRAQLAQLQAGVVQARADARLAQAELDRASALVTPGFISKADIDRRTATRDSANARVTVAVAQVRESEARLARLSIRAPEAGIVLQRMAEVGQIVSPGSGMLFRVAAGGILEMRARVAEQDLVNLKAGMPATVTPVGSRLGYSGRIWLVEPAIDTETRQGVVRIALNYDPALKVGSFAKASIIAVETQRPVLPQSAVQADDRGSFVYVVDANNKVERRAITVGTVNDQGVSIAAGLNGRERVVVSAGAFLRPGETITPVLNR